MSHDCQTIKAPVHGENVVLWLMQALPVALLPWWLMSTMKEIRMGPTGISLRFLAVEHPHVNNDDSSVDTGQ